MSFNAVTWAMQQDIRPAGRKFTLVALAQYADGDGVAYPGQKTLAKNTSQSERSVRGHLAELEKDGYLQKSYRSREDGTRTSDEYKLNLLPAESAADAVAAERPPATIVETTGRICRAMNKSENKLVSSTPPMVPPLENSAVETEKEARHESPRPKTASRIAEDWEPRPTDRSLAVELGLDAEQFRSETAKFLDYWTAEGGQRARKLNWHAAFRLWLRKAAEYGGGSAGGTGRVNTGGNRQGPPSVVSALRFLQNRRENL